jgi:hypothetical protein
MYIRSTEEGEKKRHGQSGMTSPARAWEVESYKRTHQQ